MPVTFYVKSIETHVHSFLPLNISAVSSVDALACQKKKFTHLDAVIIFLIICSFVIGCWDQNIHENSLLLQKKFEPIVKIT